MTVGAYSITNKVNLHKYVGSAMSIEDRWDGHLRALRKNCHPNSRLQRAWNKYGEENFEFTILETCNPIVEDLLAAEQKYLPEERTVEALRKLGFYNLAPIAGSTYGVKYSQESRDRISIKLEGNTRTKGKKFPGRGNHRAGTVQSEASKIQTSKALKGKKFTEEHKAKIKEAWKNRKPMSEETKAKISKAMRERNK